MKNFLKLSVITSLVIASTSIFAQESTNKEKKQDPKKEKQEVKTTKKDSASDTTKKSGTRMAINEQGMPNKKNKTKSTTSTKKEEPATKGK